MSKYTPEELAKAALLEAYVLLSIGLAALCKRSATEAAVTLFTEDLKRPPAECARFLKGLHGSIHPLYQNATAVIAGEAVPRILDMCPREHLKKIGQCNSVDSMTDWLGEFCQPEDCERIIYTVALKWMRQNKDGIIGILEGTNPAPAGWNPQANMEAKLKSMGLSNEQADAEIQIAMAKISESRRDSEKSEQ